MAKEQLIAVEMTKDGSEMTEEELDEFAEAMYAEMTTALDDKSS